MTSKKRILSAIQPTGDMHFGNYFGAVQNWVRLQEQYDCVYGVVDYHAMSMPYNPKELRENTWSILFNLIAVGVEVDNLFIQSVNQYLIDFKRDLFKIIINIIKYNMINHGLSHSKKLDSIQSNRGSN